MSRPWWQETFNQDYLDIYGPHLELRTTTEIEGIWRLCELTKVDPGQFRILDLGCGHGRHSVPLAQQGFMVTGMDQCQLFLRRARQRARRAGTAVRWVEGCFSKLTDRNHYDLVLSLYHSFGHFEDESCQEDLLRRILRSLKPGGSFLLDMWGLQDLNRHLGRQTIQMPDFDFEETVELLEEVHPRRGPLLRLKILQKMGRPSGWRQYTHSLRMYHPQQLQDLLSQVGFVNVRLYGSFDGQSTAQGDRLIALADRKG